MGQHYLVTHAPHFIGQRLVQPGEIVELPEGVKAGRWLKPAGEVAVVADLSAGQAAAGAGAFAADHISRGDYVVLGPDGARASVVFKNTGVQGEAKAQAEAEAARLNAGGDVVLDATDGGPSSGQADAGAGANSGTELPDA